MSSALNKLSTKLDPAPSTAPKFSRNVNQKITRTPSNVTSASTLLKGVPAEETKQVDPVQKDTKKNEEEEKTQKLEADPVIKDESPHPESQPADETKEPDVNAVDDIIKVAAAVNKETAPQVEVNAEKVEQSEEHPDEQPEEQPGEQPEEQFETQMLTEKNIALLFTMMKNNQSSDSFKVNLENKMLKQIVEFKKEDFVHFLL
eukprot:CAMPEP_0168346784 /NCGR_PEP_ID=MMETSP0213-20121227/18530_1 /TAXON_ID=151035 /ORGANISM="Euplotes harpa, Strain FSP1.4" /LENGTH=202 /DNA_ID=CAMNT_0008355607 /DNA_START=184 /DNA_END=792 /DNA_ORIENTATION=+